MSNFFKEVAKVMPDWVWNNYKQMLKKVLESKNRDVIAENAVLVTPKLISEIDSLRDKINGTASACAIYHKVSCVGQNIPKEICV